MQQAPRQPVVDALNLDLSQGGGLRWSQEFTLVTTNWTVSQDPVSHDSLLLKGRDLNPSSHSPSLYARIRDIDGIKLVASPEIYSSAAAAS